MKGAVVEFPVERALNKAAAAASAARVSSRQVERQAGQQLNEPARLRLRQANRLNEPAPGRRTPRQSRRGAAQAAHWSCGRFPVGR